MSSPNIIFKIQYVKTNYSDKFKKYRAKREFYSSKQNYDFINYVNSGIANGQTKDFIEYVDDKEKTAGIFNANGIIKKEDIKELRNKLQKTESNIWNGLISFPEDIGLKYCGNYKQAYDYFMKVFPRFISRAGLKFDNIEWFAGLHENTNNRHVHFCFFEKQPKKYSSKDKNLHFSNGKIKQEIIDQSKIDFELKLFGNDKRLYELRDDLIKSAKNTIALNKTYKINFVRKINSLSSFLPDDGRISYDSENMKNLKDKVNEITGFMLNGNSKLHLKFTKYVNELEVREREICKICKENKIAPFKTKDKYVLDLYRRLGNLIIQSALDCKKNKNKIQYTHKKFRYEKIQRKKHREFLINQCFYLNEKANKEIIENFENYLDKLNKFENQIKHEQRDFEM